MTVNAIIDTKKRENRDCAYLSSYYPFIDIITSTRSIDRAAPTTDPQSIDRAAQSIDSPIDSTIEVPN